METIRQVNGQHPQDVSGIARVHVDSWRSTYRGIVPDHYLDTLSYDKRIQSWNTIFNNPESRETVLVALNEDEQIVGFVSGGPARDALLDYPGELYAIYLLESAQGHGLGRRLIQALSETLLQSDLTSMYLWALTENPACRFYERLGGQYLRTQSFEIEGVQIEERAYGWPDIRTLLPARQ
ncbi:GNAT family N-acetyltransferase [Dictyobacter arantiisoli]|uniref:Acetyltransferase n=1 Tax=Dictyobacter arantiisoli TaxID=2014874 RepID=A0A5A5TBY9_9CHLR|nr:GNAT family N-acetyltransferase [Dictyobacter arantiisoli]GCF08898.1 acetyltransferase [Dictyobacter arantiisoli]